MSNFKIVQNMVKALMCQTCQGTGAVDDAEPGDTSYNEYTCPRCHGTGWKDGSEKKELITI